MAKSNRSFEKILEEKPTLAELCEHVHIIDRWHDFGIILEVDSRTLNVIEHQPLEHSSKTSKMFEKWLNTNPNATRRKIIDALRSKFMGENDLANKYEQTLRQSCISIKHVSGSIATEASTAHPTYINALSQSLINPVRVSQFLFSERCITEATLDKMETLESTLDEKTILLSAIHTAISSDYKKLIVLARVLSKFEETKFLSEKIMSEHGKEFPHDQTTVTNAQKVAMTSNSSHEEYASDILRCHYGTLFESLKYPISVAQLLHEEGVITKTKPIIEKCTAEFLSKEKAIFRILNAVRHAVHINYKNLEVFASVLLKFTSSVPCANAIIKDYEKPFPKEFLLPPTMDSKFGHIKKEFDIAFSSISKTIKNNPPPLDELKLFLEDGYSHLQSQLAHCNSINDILAVVRRNCTLINISCLESIVEGFHIKQAESQVQKYKDVIQSFCKEMKASFCLDKKFEVTKFPLILHQETAIFVLDWDPARYTLQDIRNILAESLEGNVMIRDIRKGNSIIITCFFPINLTTLLIAEAHRQETLEFLKKNRLLRLTIGHCTIYDHKIDEEVREENTSLKKKLDQQQAFSSKIAEETESIARQIKEMEGRNKQLTRVLRTKEDNEKKLHSDCVVKQSKLEKQQETIKSLESQLQERNKEIDELKLHSKVVDEKSLSVSTEKQKEKDKQQNMVTSLQSQLKEKGKQIVALERSLKETKELNEKQLTTLRKRQEVHFKVTDKEELDEKQKIIESLNLQLRDKDKEIDKLKRSLRGLGDAEHVENINCIDLYSPTVQKCEDVTSKLIKEQQTEKEWSISLFSSSPESTAVIINNLNKCTVRKLEIWNSPLDDKCTSILSEKLESNKTIKKLQLWSSSPTGGIKQVSDSLLTNTTLEDLVLYHVTITDEDTTHLFNMLVSNKVLKKFCLAYCNITDNGFLYICKGLTKNQTLTSLNIRGNRRITSVSTSTMADLIQTTTSLTELNLHGISLKEDDIKTVCTALQKTTIQELHLSKLLHQECCQKLDNYHLIEDKVIFSF